MDNLYTLCPTHGPAEAVLCVACHKPTCPQCATLVQPNVHVCGDCVAQLEAEASPTLFDDFWNPKKAPATFGFVALIILLYAASTGLTGVDPMPWVIDRVNLDVASVLQARQWDRLLWANLFHAYLAHIATNAFAILIFGQMLERLVGSRWVLLWMGLSLIATDAATIWFGPRYSLGASGIAYGLQTAFIVAMVRRELALKVKTVGEVIRSFGGYVVLMVVVNLWYAPVLNMAGHAGGAVAGGLGALLFPIQNKPKAPWLWTGLLASICLVTLAWPLLYGVHL